jgi:hypothetical protein
MKHIDKQQRARDLNREMFERRLDNRADAAYHFIKWVALLGLSAFIGVMLAWRG